MNYKSYITITLCFFISVMTNAENISQKLIDNKLSLSTNEINIRNAGFSVSILENDKPVMLIPEGKPEIKKLHRITPLGNGEETCYSWKSKYGYLISWIITQVDKDIVAIKSELTNQTSHKIYLRQFSLLNIPNEQLSVIGKASEWMLASTDVESRRWGTLDKDIPTEVELTKEQAYSRSYFSRRGISDKANDRKWRCYFSDMTLYRDPGIVGISMAG